jgi:hypothetical protein
MTNKLNANEIMQSQFDECARFIDALKYHSEDAIDFASYIALLMNYAGEVMFHEIYKFEYCEQHVHIEKSEIEEAYIQIRLIIGE